jgi:Tol biopolymer transport system component
MYYQQWGAAKTSNVVARDMASARETVLHSVTQPAVYVSGLTLSPDGQQLAFVVRDPEGALLTVMPAGGGESRVVLRTNELAWPNSIAWAPDSQGLLFVKLLKAGDPRTELWVAPLAGGVPRKLQLAAANMREIRVHPDGRRIAFTSGGDRSEVWVMENFLRSPK